MIYLLQILSMLEEKQLDYFNVLFSDIEFELEEMGYKECPQDLINEMLDNHFGLFIELDSQINMLTDCILKEGCLKSAINVSKMRRGIAC